MLLPIFTTLLTATSDTSIDSKVLEETIKGLFSKEMADMVKNASTENYVVYAFLVLSLILMIIVLIMTKVNTVNIMKTIQPYFCKVDSLAEEQHDSRKSYDKMLKKFEDLENELLRQDLERCNDNQLEDLAIKLSEHSQRDQIAFNNIINELREHDRAMVTKYIELQSIIQRVLIGIIESRDREDT